MITVCLNKADFEYDIHSLVKAFYPVQEVKVFADPEKIHSLEQHVAPLFRLDIFYHTGGQGQKDRIELILRRLPAEAEEESRIDVRKETEADFADRKETKNQLKRCLYRMLSEYTGKKLPWGTLTGIRPVKIPMSMLEAGRQESEIKAYITETYLASEQKTDLSIEIAGREMELLRQMDYKDGYSLYVGIPFCPSICSYCSFSSSPIAVWKDRVESFLNALAHEIDSAAQICSGRKLNTIYIGGGTPTTLTPSQLERLLSKIETSFEFSHLAEYTVEAGRPDSITRDKLNLLKIHGVSRISINPQTMKQETLNIIGRRHTVEQTTEAFWLARKLGFDNINMDLILGLPGEGIKDVEYTMESIKTLSPDSLTIHSLAMKRAARFQMFPEEYQKFSMTNSWEAVDLTSEYARKMELFPYYLYRQKNMAGNFENVGYAKSGKEGIYNILMMEEVQDIVALGAGSISKRVYPDGRIERCENVKDVASFIERIDEMIERKRKLLTDF
ncbi:MAG: coproporphyrinogen dehydrogenase HemZ [Lachnospiraceae bacterium]|nr:coproporphyrinogen dehydrogenase HemZ [Lachnospiraceae bacterium]